MINNKNIKKFLAFSLLITTISVTSTECCERKINSTNGSQSSEEDDSIIEFSDICTPKKYKTLCNKLPSKTQTYVTIICDICKQNSKYYPRTTTLGAAYFNINKHRADKHSTCKYNNLHETPNEADFCNLKKIGYCNKKNKKQ